MQAALVTLCLLCTATGAAQAASSQPEQRQPTAPAQVARTALQTDRQSLLELQRLQLRENELRQMRNAHSAAGPGVGLGIGVAGAALTIPFGAALLAIGHTSDDPTDGSGVPGESDDTGAALRITGGLLLGVGVAALVTAVACGVRVRQLRPIRRGADQELRAIRLLRVRTLDALTLRAGPDSLASIMPAEVAHAALDADRRTLGELQQLQRREREAWNVRRQSSLAWPAVGLGVGSLLSPIMVPLGSAFLASSDNSESSTSSDGTADASGDTSRRAGGILLGVGLVAVATVVYCSILVHRRRHAKRWANHELLTIREERTRLLGTLMPAAELPAP